MDSKEETNAEGTRREMAAENSDTVARKRARRVSFAEMTSVHFFDRDEESNGTPSAATAKMVDDSPGEFGFRGISERNKEFGGEDDGEENIDDEVMEMQRSFLRPIGSPSSGGSTLGSASSNDEDNFFGPVSANFIRPGRLSDSAASDENHDLTMDSTAFSMHFRSLARSESGLDLKTPTGDHLFFEEKTPTDSNKGSSMDFTLGKKLIPKSPVPAAERSANHSSNDMSLVGETTIKYDYEKLSPGLDALLAESRKNLLYICAADNITSVSLESNMRQALSSVHHGTLLNGDQSNARIELVYADESHGNLLGGGSPRKFSSSTLGIAASNIESHEANSSPHQLSKDEFNSSLVASRSSPVKLQQTLLTTASPSKPWRVTTPMPEKHGSLLRNGSIDHLEIETSIQRSISKLELLENAASSSTFSAKVDRSTIRSLDFLKSPNVMENNDDISRTDIMDNSIHEEKLASVNRSAEMNFAVGMDHIRGENPGNKSLSQTVNEQLSNGLNAKSISAGTSKPGPTSASLSKKTWSGRRSLFTSKLNHEDPLTTETDSLLAETSFGEGGKAITPKFVPSPDRVFDRTLPASPGGEGGKAITPKFVPSPGMVFDRTLLASPGILPVDLQSQLNQMTHFDEGRDSAPERDLRHVTSTATDKSDVVSEGMNVVNRQLRSPFVEVNRLNLAEPPVTDTKTNMHNVYEKTSGNFSTPAKENQFQVVHPDVGDPTNRNISSIEDNILGAESRMVSHESVSLSAQRRNSDQPHTQFPAGSPPRKESDDNQPFSISSPRNIQMSCGRENYSADKRNIQLLLEDPQHRAEFTTFERSPKLHKSGNYEPEKFVYSIDRRTKLNSREKEKLADAYYTEDIKILIFESADKLSSKMVDKLEDMLVHQQRVKTYEMFQLSVAPQSANVHHDPQHEKIAETKSLLHRLVYEKAKLQLKHVKRERLLKKLDLLSSRMQDSQALRANIASLPLSMCTSTVGAAGHHSSSVNLTKEHEVYHDTLNSMRRAVEGLDRNILTLMRSFHARCKLKDDPGVGETIALVNEHLAKKTSCRFIRLDMQMWVVQGIASVNGQHNVTLNYLDFIIQSIKIIVGPMSSFRSTFKLNETNITKKFPNMDACVAFGFVFNIETARKFVGAKTLVQETQVTSSLLGSLLDVVEEVQIAQIELKNLTWSSFSSPSVDRLDLTLCFFNFDSGRKLSLTLDLSCLKRGLYPSEILPLELSTPIDICAHTSSGAILNKVRDAVKDVKTQYTRILNICRCASQVVQTLTV